MCVCVCVCDICSIIIAYVIVAFIIVFRRLLSSTRVCMSARMRDTRDAQMTQGFTGLIEMEPLTVGGGGRVSCTLAEHRLTSRISPSPPKVYGGGTLSLICFADDRSRVRLFYIVL